MALDQRTKNARWLDEFERRGGLLTVRAVTLEDLDAIQAKNDLTFVAAGKGAINALFARDESRSEHTQLPRKLAAVLMRGPHLLGERPWKRADYCPLRFNSRGLLSLRS
jgi:hypothetical protein